MPQEIRFLWHRAALGSPPPVTTQTGGPDPPPDRLRRRRPRHPCGSPGSPRPLFFRLPPSHPGSERAPTGAHKPLFFVQTRALLCTTSLLLDVSGFSFFVCSSTIKYNVTWHPRAPSLLSSNGHGTVDLRPVTWKTLNLLASGLHRSVQGVDSDPLRAVFSYKRHTKAGSSGRKTVSRAHFGTVRTAEEVHVSI